MGIRALLVLPLLGWSAFAQAGEYVPVLPIASPLPVEVYLAQHALGIDTPATGHPGGILGDYLADGVESGRTQRGEQRIANTRELLRDYDFNARYLEAFRRAFPADISPDPRITPLDLLLRWESFPYALNDQAHPATDPPMGLVLKVQGKWAMSYTLQKLYVRTSLFLVRRSLDRKGKIEEEVLLSRSYSFDAVLDRAWGVEPEVNQRRWDGIGKPEIERLLDLGIAHNMDMLAYDFSPAGRAMLTRRANAFETSKYKGKSLYGRILRETPEWYWAYPARDEERYLPRSMVSIYALEAKAGGEAAPEVRDGPPVRDPARPTR